MESSEWIRIGWMHKIYRQGWLSTIHLKILESTGKKECWMKSKNKSWGRISRASSKPTVELKFQKVRELDLGLQAEVSSDWRVSSKWWAILRLFQPRFCLIRYLTLLRFHTDRKGLSLSILRFCGLLLTSILLIQPKSSNSKSREVPWWEKEERAMPMLKTSGSIKLKTPTWNWRESTIIRLVKSRDKAWQQVMEIDSSL